MLDRCLACGKPMVRSKVFIRYCSPECARALAKQNYDCKPASRPTLAEPGTRAKIEVMQQRIANHEECFHPQDAQRQ